MRQTTLALLFVCTVIQASAEFPESIQEIELATSLETDARLSKQGQRPIVVFISQFGCQYCRSLREQVLLPMIRADEWRAKVLLREVRLDDGFTIIDFSGETIDGRAFARRYDAEVTPTILFLDEYGGELTDRIVGISNIEFYGFYLDKAIISATKAISAGKGTN